MDPTLSRLIMRFAANPDEMEPRVVAELLDAAAKAPLFLRDAVHLALSALFQGGNAGSQAADVRARLAPDIDVQVTQERVRALVSDPAATSSTVAALGVLLELISPGAQAQPIRPDGSPDHAAAAILAARAIRGDAESAAALSESVFSGHRKYAAAFRGLRDRHPGLADLLDHYRPRERPFIRRAREAVRMVRRVEAPAILVAAGSLLTLAASIALGVTLARSGPMGTKPSDHGLFATANADHLAHELAGRAVIVLPCADADEIEGYLSRLKIEGGILIGADAAERAFGQPIPRGLSATSWITPADAKRLVGAAGGDPATKPAVVAQALRRADGRTQLRITSVPDSHEILSVVVPTEHGGPGRPPAAEELIGELDIALRNGTANLDTGMVRVRQALAVADSDLEKFRVHAAAALLHLRFAPDGKGPLFEAAAAHARLAVVYGEKARSRMDNAEAERLGRLKQLFPTPPGLELPAAYQGAGRG